MSSVREDLVVLRNRRVARLIIARTISVLGSAFAPVALAFGVLHLPHGDQNLLSLVLACESIPMVAFMLFGGVFADRFPRNKVLMVGEISTGTAFTIIGVMILIGWTPTVVLCLAAAFSGIGIALIYPALTGIIPEVVPKEHLQAGNALLAFGANTARIAGLVLSGLVVALVGAEFSLLLTGAFFFAAAIVLSGLGFTEIKGKDAEPSSVMHDLRVGWKEFTKHTWLWFIVAQWSVMVMFLQGAHAVLGPVLADSELGGARTWSMVLAAEAAGMLTGVFFAIRLRPKRPLLVACAVLIPTAPTLYFLLSIGAPIWACAVAAFAMGLAFDLFGVLWQTTMQREVPPESLSRVASYDALGSLMFAPLGLLLAGPLSVAVGVHRALLISAIALAVIGLIPLLCRDIWRLQWREPAAEPQVEINVEPAAQTQAELAAEIEAEQPTVPQPQNR